MKYPFLFFILLIILLGKVCGQKNTILVEDSTKVNYYFLDPNALFVDTFSLDTSLYFLNRFDYANQFYNLDLNLGNIGLPHKNLFNFNTNTLFHTNENVLYRYWLSSSLNQKFISLIPYSELLYVNGGSEENYINFRLNTRISKNIYLGFHYNVENSKGIFEHQKSINNHFNLLLNFKTNNNKYFTVFNVVRDKAKIEENGGLYDFWQYEDTLITNRELIDVNLIDANNLFQNTKLFIEQRYYLQKTDSNFFNKLGYFYTSFDLSSGLRVYTDNAKYPYYSTILLDSAKTFDSTHVNTINIVAGWTNSNNQTKKSLYKLFANYQLVNYYNISGLNEYQYLIPNFVYAFKNSKWKGNLSFNYKILINSSDTIRPGDNDLHLASSLSFSLNPQSLLGLNLSIDNYSPDIDLIRYSGNHFQWDNSFSKTNRILGQINASIFKFKIELNTYFLTNHVIISPALSPLQINKTIQISQLSISREIFYKKLKIFPFISVQNSSLPSAINLPNFIGKMNFSYSFYLFKNAINLSPGIDITYYSSFYSDTYNPALARFVVQNRKQLIDQIGIDLFLNFKVKGARIFLLYSNINSIINSYNYSQISGYPQKDGVFRFGVSWRFFN